MEISSVQNYYRMQNAQQVSRVKRPTEDSTTAAVSTQNYEMDTVDISADACFRSSIAASARTYAAQNTQQASAERIAALKQSYAGDNTLVSGKDIAASVMRSAFGVALE